MPTSSPCSFEIRSEISSLARSRRVGFRSWASILRDMSRATITCTPPCSTSSISLPHWGRAMASMSRATPTNHRTIRRTRILGLGAKLNRCTRAGSPIRRNDAARRLRPHHANSISAGSAISMSRNCGAPKVISAYGNLLNTVWERTNSASSSASAGSTNHARTSS